jgi:two-component system, NtrC family, sensor kinase
MKIRRRRATKLKRRKEPIAARGRGSSAADLQEQLDRRTHELAEAGELQAASAEVLRVISTSPTDVQPVFDAIAESAVRLCRGQFSFVARFDNNLLRFGACHGLTPEGLEAFQRVFPRPAGEDTAAGRAILRRTIVQIPDVLADRDYGVLGLAQVVTYRSILAVPMLRDGHPIGTIAVPRAQVGPFSQGQIALLQTFADQAVIAIENARLFDDVQARTRELSEALEQQTATSEVLRVISSSPGDLEPVFEAMLGNATRLCEARFGILYLCEGEAFRAVALHGVPLAYAEERRREPVIHPGPKTAFGRVARTRQVVHIADITAEQAYSEGYRPFIAVAELGGCRTLLAVPMLKENELVGAIVIYRQEVRPFTDKQIDLVTNFARQAVIAIENTRLLNELRQRTDDLSESLEQQTATSEVLRVISSSPGDLEPVFQTILANAVRICEATFGTLFLRDGDAFRVVAMHNAPPAYADARKREPLVRPKPDTALGGVARTKQVMQTADIRRMQSYIERDPSVVAAAELAGYRTVVCVPMLKDNELIGAISIYRQVVRPFTDRQTELVQNFANQAVIAIENTRLLNELRQRTDDLSEALEQQTATSQVLQVVSSSPGESKCSGL